MNADESFLTQRSLIMDVIRQLEDIQNANKMDTGTKGKEEKKPEVDLSQGVTNTSFVVFARDIRKKSSRPFKRVHKNSNTSQISFMRQIDASPKERAEARRDRENVADSFRRLGNEEYRRTNYEKAIYYYSKAIQYVADSPVLYCNRALAKIKKRDFKLALFDLDYVIFKLDPIHLKAWLYRAGALARLNNEEESNNAIATARVLNRSKKDQKYIDFFLEKLRTDF
ncbi:tetratricopeptide repeat protein 12 [Drosophila ficusphila]|uniref:tetratricopeptide repeat protein 12 n=1 Tax=Drosophila ficusphila TaxID=30025 RepID=UPI0007E65DB9|nr:tetratricopeptide repeat protein 12 [Drosophila ficusphila]